MVADVQATTPDQIMQLGFGYWGSKTLLSAVELGVFTALAVAPLDADEGRGLPRLLDALDAAQVGAEADDHAGQPSGPATRTLSPMARGSN